jgi:hypothetical protein
MLVEERDALVCFVYLSPRVGVVIGECICKGMQGLGRPYISLGTTVEAEVARPRPYAVDPPVGPVAGVGLDTLCQPLFGRGENSLLVARRSCG